MFLFFSQSRAVTLLILLVALFKSSYAQTEFFGEFSAKKTFELKESWAVELDANYKHAYQNSKWRRVSLNSRLLRRFGHQWKIFLGLTNNLRFDNKLGDFFELRPSLGVNFDLAIIPKLHFNQRVLIESRNFFINEHNHYFRSRLRSQLAYTFKDAIWKIFTGFEWYILRDPSDNERFANSREFSLGLRKKTKKNHAIVITYHREIFLSRSNNSGVQANTIALYYEF